MGNEKSPGVKASKAAKTAVDPLRARLDSATSALGASDVGKVPWMADERAKHLAGFVAAATRDASELCAVALPEGNVEPWEIAVLPVAITVAEALGALVLADQVASGATLSDADAKLLGEVRAAQKTVSWAFRRLRYRGQAPKIKELDAIEAGDPDDLSDAHSDSARLIAIANHDEERAWFASLACGEPAALAVLEKHQPRLGELAKRAVGVKAAAARRDQLARVWTVIGRIEQRVRDAVDYRYRTDPRRAEYKAYETPSERKRKAERKAERPKKAAAKKAAKAAAEAEKKAAKAAKKKKG
jgi:hypothetical protein